jgi:hypothetical protein
MDGLSLLITALTGLASSFLLGLFKSSTGALDTKIGAAIKPVQPLIILGLSAALPLIIHATGITGSLDPTQLVNAPTATIIGVVAREIATKLTPKPTQ